MEDFSDQKTRPVERGCLVDRPKSSSVWRPVPLARYPLASVCRGHAISVVLGVVWGPIRSDCNSLVSTDRHIVLSDLYCFAAHIQIETASAIRISEWK
jgi:hypothetical protein